MVDYLGQLLLRGRQRDEAIQPRLSSRFEAPHRATVESPAPSWPDGQEADLLPASNEALADTAADSTTSNESRHREPRRQDAFPGSQPIDSMPSVDQAPTEAQPVLPAAPRRVAARQPRGLPLSAEKLPIDAADRAHEPVEARPSVDRVRPPRRAEPAVPSLVQAQPGSPAPSARIVRGERAPHITELPSPFAASRHLPDRSGRPEQITTLFDRQVLQRNVAGPVERRPSGQALSGVLGGEFHAPSTHSERDATRRSGDPEGPTIHVTIGRVEIRASVAAVESRKTPVRTPAMSLEEYLKQRKGGAR